MKDVLKELLERFSTFKDYNIKEAFLMNGELYITSEYNISFKNYNLAEEYALSLN